MKEYEIPSQCADMASEPAVMNCVGSVQPEVANVVTRGKTHESVSSSLKDGIKDTSVSAWFLGQMVAQSQKDFEEGRVYTHEEVKRMLRQRRHEDTLGTESV